MSEAAAAKATPKKQFLALLKEHGLKAEKVAGINGEIGARIKHAIENASLHRGAYSFVRKLVKMSEEKRSDLLGSIEIYSDYAREAGLFGSEHVGDLVDQAQDAGPEAEQQAADDAQVEANTEALEKGIKPLDSAGLADLYERGRFAFLDGKPGMIPDDLAGEPKKGAEFLRGWGDVGKMTAEDRAALRAPAGGEPFEDDAVAKKPSRRGKAVLEGADAPGSYAITH